MTGWKRVFCPLLTEREEEQRATSRPHTQSLTHTHTDTFALECTHIQAHTFERMHTHTHTAAGELPEHHAAISQSLAQGEEI